MSLETLANVRVAFDAHVAVVTLDRPPVNAQTLSFQEEIAYAFDYLSDLDEVRAIVLTGAGKVFCAGVDLKERAGKDWAPAPSGKAASAPLTSSMSSRMPRSSTAEINSSFDL
jgi:enoyl-CoA hydratase/carnithine racemase